MGQPARFHGLPPRVRFPTPTCDDGAAVLLSELLSADRIKVPLGGLTKDDLLKELVDLAAPTADQSAKEAILAAVQEREQLLSTGIGAGVAIPHGKTPVTGKPNSAPGGT